MALRFLGVGRAADNSPCQSADGLPRKSTSPEPASGTHKGALACRQHLGIVLRREQVTVDLRRHGKRACPMQGTCTVLRGRAQPTVLWPCRAPTGEKCRSACRPGYFARITGDPSSPVTGLRFLSRIEMATRAASCSHRQARRRALPCHSTRLLPFGRPSSPFGHANFYYFTALMPSCGTVMVRRLAAAFGLPSSPPLIWRTKSTSFQTSPRNSDRRSPERPWRRTPANGPRRCSGAHEFRRASDIHANDHPLVGGAQSPCGDACGRAPGCVY